MGGGLLMCFKLIFLHGLRNKLSNSAITVRIEKTPWAPTREKKSVIKSPNISDFFRQISGYISDFTMIYPEKNLADLIRQIRYLFKAIN